ncbi:MAG TPA: alpha-amylase family glycosyl hydrolase [Polyangiaceae bacterium]|nr:alpha-amylase family glycosyl hydrolase [Polyangiaceae bacterium]
MKRRVSWACLAGAMVLAPLALIGCGDDDDNPGTGGNGGTGGSGTMQGSGGGPAMGSAGSGGGPGACVASAGLVRTPGGACADTLLVCRQQFVFDPAKYTGTDTRPIVSVEIRGNYLADTAWGTGVYMTLDAADGKWKGLLELAKDKEVLYQYYILREGDAWNGGEWIKDPDNDPGATEGNSKVTPTCTPECARRDEAWSPKAACEPQPATPAGRTWDWRDAVIYFAFVDRFFNGNTQNDAPVPNPAVDQPIQEIANYAGGDYAGVIAKINANYFNDLGVNTLWVTVPFDNPDQYSSPTAPADQCDGTDQYSVACYRYTGYHGYWPLDQWPAEPPADGNRTEEKFGTEQELKDLVTAAHAKGLKVIFDYAMVHVHEDSPIYQEFLDFVKGGKVPVPNGKGVNQHWFTPKYAVDEQGYYIRPVFDTEGNLEGVARVFATGGVPVRYIDFPAPQLVTTDPDNAANYLPPGVALADLFECNCSGETICNWDGKVDKNLGINLPTIGERCWFQGYLPHLNYKDAPGATPNPARDYSLDAAERFITEVGADGFRLDAVKHIDRAWYTELRTRLEAKGLPEHFYLVGETYDFNQRYNLDRFIDPATMLDGQFDFPFRAQAARAILKRDADIGMDTLAHFMDTNDEYYGCTAVMSTWLGNHDVGRPIHIAEGLWDQYSDAKDRAWTNQPVQPGTREPYERLATGFAVMMTNPGAPLIYYGDEYGLAGAGDPDNRRVFFDDAGNYAANEHQQALNTKLKAYTKIRKDHSALRRGVRTTITASKDVWIYKMTDAAGGDEVFVAVNRADAAATSCGDLPAGAYVDLVTNTDKQGESLTIDPRSALILVKK